MSVEWPTAAGDRATAEATDVTISVARPANLVSGDIMLVLAMQSDDDPVIAESGSSDFTLAKWLGVGGVSSDVGLAVFWALADDLGAGPWAFASGAAEFRMILAQRITGADQTDPIPSANIQTGSAGPGANTVAVADNDAGTNSTFLDVCFAAHYQDNGQTIDSVTGSYDKQTWDADDNYASVGAAVFTKLPGYNGGVTVTWAADEEKLGVIRFGIQPPTGRLDPSRLDTSRLDRSRLTTARLNDSGD